MGRSPVISQKQKHLSSQMNKLLLLVAIGLGLLAFTAGSSEEGNQVGSFESGLARGVRGADPGTRQRKVAKNKKRSKHVQKKRNNKNSQRKKTRSNKRKGLSGKKGQQQKRKARKNGQRSGKGKKKAENKKNKKK